MAKRRVLRGSSKRPVRARKQKRSAKKAAVGTRAKGRIAKRRKAAGIVEDAWAPSPFALWMQQWDDPSGSNPSAILLRHPTAPFVARGPQIDETSLHAIALDYLTHANFPPLGIPPDWLRSLKREDDLFFGWLPLSWPAQDFTDRNAGDPLVSFSIDARLPDGTKLPDDTVVLLAGEKIIGVPSGSGHGIRVIAHTHTDKKKGVEVRITGMSASVPPVGLDGRNKSMRDKTPSSLRNKIASILRNKTARDALRAQMALSAGLSDSSPVHIRGVRFVEVDGEQRVEVRGTVGVTSSNPTPYSGIFLLQEGGPPLALLSKVELVADAATPGGTGVFLTDPASQGGSQDIVQRRPTRSQDALNNCRDPEQITNGRKVPLYYPTPAFPEDVVVVCPGFSFEDKGLPQGTPKAVDLPGDVNVPEVRSNDFAAVSAYWNVEQLFLRLAAYGLNNSPDPRNPTYSYFRIAKLPLELRYRSGVGPGRGKDGQTVNARVLVDGWKSDFVGPTAPGDRPELTIHCALGNLSTRERKPRQGNARSPAEPLGIAADPRWMWHEIGHVLLMACVGYLQFPFAHSAGDALAAIVGDAESKLARQNVNWRGATFPWVFIPRRHDRSVLQGWSWAGSMHHAAAQVPPSEQLRRKGYWTEQILSSSLFRLYRCIGGDTDADPGNPDARESASHYAVYLIMRGIQIYGTYDVLSRSEPDHLVTALMDADIGTGLWDVAFPFPQPLQFHRVGGCVHKVIRWAFEAQGMYGSMLRNAPGLPPPADIYIRDLRPIVDDTPYGDIAYGEGSYVPVSLHCNPTDPTPLWQADPNAIAVAANGDISVTVGNRGTRPANNVAVDVWWHAWPVGQQALPDWDGSTWTPCGSPGNPLQTINPGDTKTFVFRPAPAQAGNRYLLFARATCADDLANIDAATGLPCSNQPTPLIDLVASDNNLGLRVVARSAPRPITVRQATRPGRA